MWLYLLPGLGIDIFNLKCTPKIDSDILLGYRKLSIVIKFFCVQSGLYADILQRGGELGDFKKRGGGEGGGQLRAA